MKKVTKTLAEIFAFVLFAVVLTLSILYFSRLYTPERTSYGATWNMYLNEQEDSVDVMFFGSSMVYCDVVPARIYENSGITSYVMTAPEMTLPQAYYYIKESLNTQSPDVMFVELSGMYFPDNSNHTDETVGLMPYSANRLAATIVTAEPEAQMALFFPLYKYHDRWQEVSPSDVRADMAADPFAGYTPTIGVLESISQRREWTFDETNVKFEKNTEYLNKIVDLCEKEGIKPVFFLAPACSNYSAENVEKIRNAVGDELFWDCNAEFDSFGFDMQSDFYDPLHLNLAGALKFSDFLSSYISRNYEISDRESDSELWNLRVNKIEELISQSAE